MSEKEPPNQGAKEKEPINLDEFRRRKEEDARTMQIQIESYAYLRRIIAASQNPALDWSVPFAKYRPRFVVPIDLPKEEKWRRFDASLNPVTEERPNKKLLNSITLYIAREMGFEIVNEPYQIKADFHEYKLGNIKVLVARAKNPKMGNAFLVRFLVDKPKRGESEIEQNIVACPSEEQLMPHIESRFARRFRRLK